MDRYGRSRMPLGMSPRKLARGLGWFSIGLGVTELLLPRTLSRALGMRGEAGLVALYGLREIATGVGILSARNPKPWVWARVAGDALDLATLADRMDADNSKRANVALAMGTAATATVVDVLCAAALPSEQPPRESAYDYSDRSGLPRSPAEMRGSARPDWAGPMPGSEGAARPH